MSTPTRVAVLAAALFAIAMTMATVHFALRHRGSSAEEAADISNDLPPRVEAPAVVWRAPPRPTTSPTALYEPHDADSQNGRGDHRAPTVVGAVAPDPNVIAIDRAASGVAAVAVTADSGLDVPGNTDLTRAEWRILGERGELRFRLPAQTEQESLVDDTRARALGLRTETIAPCNEVLRQGSAQLVRDVQGYYREASGGDPAGSFASLLDEISSRTPSDIVARVNGELARERGGVSPWQATTPEMTPYERMLRELIAYEAMIEHQLSAIVGPESAHALVWGDNAVGASSYAYRGAQP